MNNFKIGDMIEDMYGKDYLSCDIDRIGIILKYHENPDYYEKSDFYEIYFPKSRYIANRSGIYAKRNFAKLGE